MEAAAQSSPRTTRGCSSGVCTAEEAAGANSAPHAAAAGGGASWQKPQRTPLEPVNTSFAARPLQGPAGAAKQSHAGTDEGQGQKRRPTELWQQAHRTRQQLSDTQAALEQEQASNAAMQSQLAQLCKAATGTDAVSHSMPKVGSNAFSLFR